MGNDRRYCIDLEEIGGIVATAQVQILTSKGVDESAFYKRREKEFRIRTYSPALL